MKYKIRNKSSGKILEDYETDDLWLKKDGNVYCISLEITGGHHYSIEWEKRPILEAVPYDT